MHTSKTIPFYLINPSSTTSTPHLNPTFQHLQLQSPQHSPFYHLSITPTIILSSSIPPHTQTIHQTPHNPKPPHRKFFSSQINQIQPIFTPLPSPSHIPAQKLATHSQSTTQLQINQFFSTFDTTAAVFQFFTLKNRILYCHL